MPSEGSVTHWINQLRAGDPAAAQELWQRYFHRLVGLARDKLRHQPRLGADEEDVALSAFDTFCRGAEQGRFPRLHDRDNLWGLLVTLTARKAAHLLRDEHRQKRGGAVLLGESALVDPSASAPDAGLHQIAGREPTPAFAAEEIAAKLGCVVRSVERKLQLIRDLWESEVAP